jgi:pseudaminic acid synthase
VSEPRFQIAGRLIGRDHPPYVIAELSANHNGDFSRAVAIIEAAARAGADAVKLQTYTADTMTIAHDGRGFRIEDGPWAGRTLYDLYREAYTPWEWHEELFAVGRRSGVCVFSSPFDSTAIDFLESLDAPAYKIASFEIVDIPLIRYAAATGKPLVISTGMASDDDIATAVDAAREAGCQELALLHCVSGYPTPPEEMNLRVIQTLWREYHCTVGVSDHTIGTVVPVAAVAVGACMIEKHVTLKRSDGGPDAAFSVEPDELDELVSAARTAWSSLGNEERHRQKSEALNEPFRRSLYVVADVAAGEVFTSHNIRAIRPGYGLPPKHLPEVLGLHAARSLTRGTPLAWGSVAESKGRD